MRGWRIVFVDVDGRLVQRLNERGRYTIFRATVEGFAREAIEGGFTAVHTSDKATLEALFLQKGLMLDVAVHAIELQRVAEMFAPLIQLRAVQAQCALEYTHECQHIPPGRRLWRDAPFAESGQCFNAKLSFVLCGTSLGYETVLESMSDANMRALLHGGADGLEKIL